MAVSRDLPLRRDKTLIFDGVAKKRSPSGALTLLDLTGATIFLSVRKLVGADEEMFRLDSGTPSTDGRIDIAADQTADRGEYVVRIEDAATGDESEFPDDEAAYYPYELWVEEASGEVTPLAYGSFQYSPDVP